MTKAWNSKRTSHHPLKTNGSSKMMGLGKGGTPAEKDGHFWVSILDFWGVHQMFADFQPFFHGKDLGFPSSNLKVATKNLLAFQVPGGGHPAGFVMDSGSLVFVVSFHLLLMAEILHHLGCMKPYKQWDKLPTSTGAGFQPSTVCTGLTTYFFREYPWQPGTSLPGTKAVKLVVGPTSKIPRSTHSGAG